MYPDAIVINFLHEPFVIGLGDLGNRFIGKPGAYNDNTVEVVFFVPGRIGFVLRLSKSPRSLAEGARRALLSICILLPLPQRIYWRRFSPDPQVPAHAFQIP